MPLLRGARRDLPGAHPRIRRLVESRPPEQRDPALPPGDTGVVGADGAQLAVAVSVGASLFDGRFGLGDRRPAELVAMPFLANDRLDPARTLGDLLQTIASARPDRTLHALRQLMRAYPVRAGPAPHPLPAPDPTSRRPTADACPNLGRMPARIAVVTDSTAYLPDDLVRKHEVSVVPLQVVVGGEAHDEGIDVTSEQVAEALRTYVPVSTSRPSPATFLAAYRAAAEGGATGIVSVHLSADMSGTHQSAALAARDAPVPTRVVDSRTLGMALGYAVAAAAERAAAGGSLDEVADAAERRARASSAFFYVDTLEHLRRGGRIGAAQALLGSALMVKPLLHLVDGRIAPLDKVRTSARAIARLEEMAVDRAAAAPGVVDVAVHHLASLDRANALADRLRQRIERLGELHVGEVGAVVGAHVGPGMLAVVIAPREASSD